VPKLNQIIAIEKGVKSSTTSAMTLLHRKSQVADLLSGITRTYEPKDAEGDQLPGEFTHVQLRHAEMLQNLGEVMTELFDVTATKDWANTEAKADVVLENGDTLLEAVPPTYLLFLEKQLVDIHTFVAKLPVLDPSFEWEFDQARGYYVTPPKESTRTVKLPKAFVKYEATDKHPAQVDTFTEDKIVGTWTTVKMSGAIRETDKREILARIVALQKAVKFAREEANASEVTSKKTGQAIFDYLFGDEQQ
jgi:hypothetical protein